MALIVQKTGQRQGNANPRFYQLAAAQHAGTGPVIYHDTISGSNTVPGVTGYSCTTGYDLATGFGSVDANALVTNWAAPTNPDFTVAVSPTSANVVQGASAIATVTLTVAAPSSSATLFSNGFEGTTTGWYVSSGAWTLTGAGIHPSAKPHGGTQMVAFGSYTLRSGSQSRLYRNAGFAIPATASKTTLTFWMYHDAIYINKDQIQPQVSTNGTSWTNVGPAVLRYNGTTGWSQVTVDLSTYKGKTVYLGFLGTSGFGNDMYLDDVQVATP